MNGIVVKDGDGQNVYYEDFYMSHISSFSNLRLKGTSEKWSTKNIHYFLYSALDW